MTMMIFRKKITKRTATKTLNLTTTKLKLIKEELNQNVLKRAIKMAESEWLWRFRSIDYRLKKVAQVYNYLLRLVEKES
jgi:hypothetical protein